MTKEVMIQDIMEFVGQNWMAVEAEKGIKISEALESDTRINACEFCGKYVLTAEGITRIIRDPEDGAYETTFMCHACNARVAEEE